MWERYLTVQIRKKLKIFAPIWLFFAVGALSFNLMAREVEREIEKLEDKMQKRAENLTELQDIKREIQKLENLYSMLEVGKAKIGALKEFCVFLSRALASGTFLNSALLVPENGQISFVLEGIAKNPRKVSVFKRKLTRKRGKVRAYAQIKKLESKDDEDWTTSFTIEGRFWLAEK